MVPLAWPSRARLAHTLGRQPRRIAVAATLLAAHFGTYTAALYHVEVARAVLLVSTQPLFVVLAGAVLERERPPAAVLGFLGLAFAGLVVMFAEGLDSFTFGRGEALAVTSAAFLGLYIVQGRRVRRDVPVSHYNVPLYLLAGMLLLITAHVRGEASIEWSWSVHGLLLALAIGPTLCGHSVFHWGVEIRVVDRGFGGVPGARRWAPGCWRGSRSVRCRRRRHCSEERFAWSVWSAWWWRKPGVRHRIPAHRIQDSATADGAPSQRECAVPLNRSPAARWRRHVAHPLATPSTPMSRQDRDAEVNKRLLSSWGPRPRSDSFQAVNVNLEFGLQRDQVHVPENFLENLPVALGAEGLKQWFEQLLAFPHDEGSA